MELIIRLKLRERNLIYTPQEKYIRCGAQFPGTPSPISILEAPFPTLRVRFCLPFRSFAISSTPTWCPPHVPKTEGKPGKKSRKQSQEGMLGGAQNGQKPPPPNHPFWLAACLRVLMMVQVHHSEILCKRMSWMVAQTMARQLVSVVNTSI